VEDGQEEYIRQVLGAYRKTPGTMGMARRADRVLAAQLYQRGISVSVIEKTRRHPTIGLDSLAGLFPTSDRRSVGHARQPGVLPISPPQARTDHAIPLDARTLRASAG